METWTAHWCKSAHVLAKDSSCREPNTIYDTCMSWNNRSLFASWLLAVITWSKSVSQYEKCMWWKEKSYNIGDVHKNWFLVGLLCGSTHQQHSKWYVLNRVTNLSQVFLSSFCFWLTFVDMEPCCVFVHVCQPWWRCKTSMLLDENIVLSAVHCLAACSLFAYSGPQVQEEVSGSLAIIVPVWEHADTARRAKWSQDFCCFP